MSRSLDDLHPTVADLARQLVDLCQQNGIELLITSTLRTFEEQDALYAIGRTKPGKVVTNARSGQSWHNYGLAFDVVPLVNGKAIWTSPNWESIGALGMTLGLVWGGQWAGFKDKPHFEYHPGLTLAEAMAKKEAGESLL